jgi:hypothetical protein
MNPTGVSINKESWALLREEPLYSARFIDREGTEELALVFRVEVLDFFFDMHPPLTLDVNAWQSSQGVWIVLVTYQIPTPGGPPQTGVFYLNPRHAADREILRKLSQRDTLSVIFLSEDCQEHYTVSIVHDPQMFVQWQSQISEIAQNTQESLPIHNTDSAFEAAMQELEAGVS